MDFSVPGWMQGVLAFVGLLVVNFIVNVLSNSATPLTQRFAYLMKGKVKDWRRDYLIYLLSVSLCIYKRPSIGVSRIIINLSNLVLSLFMFIVYIQAKITSYELTSIIDNNIFMNITKYYVLIVASMSLLNIQNNYIMLSSYPRRMKALIKKLNYYGVCEADAWERAIRNFEKWNLNIRELDSDKQ